MGEIFIDLQNYKMKEICKENKLLQMIAHQTLDPNDVEWLTENLPKAPDWFSLARKAFDEGLASFLYRHCKNMNLLDTMPNDAKIFLARIYSETLLINHHFLKEMAELEKRLGKQGLKVIVFKGAALLGTVYRDIALRPMEDIDLIVHKEHVEELKDVLLAMGFVQNGLYPESFAKGILCVDIHYDYLSSHRIQSRQQSSDIKTNDVWEAAIPFDGSTSLYRLSLHDNLIALSFHLMKHRYERLIGFVDIAECLKAYQHMSDWQDLVSYSKQVHADRVLLYALILTRRLLSVDIPEELFMALGKRNLSTTETYLLRLKLMRAPMGTVTDILWMFQVRGLRKKGQFIIENIFPRREIMRQIFPDVPHRSTAFLERTFRMSSNILYDLFRTARIALKNNLPPLF